MNTMNVDFGNDFLKKAAARVPQTDDIEIQLSRNELPYDLPEEIKSELYGDLNQRNWNRYPSSSNTELEEKVAEYAKVSREKVVLGAGSAHLLTSLMNYFAINKYQLILAEPSFSLFEYHCKSYGIEYQTWPLDSEYEYTAKTLPATGKKSAVILASPNNPTGTVISKTLLETLLKQHSETIFIVDEVYFEFHKESAVDLIDNHDNLIVVRSLSKAMGIAGLRIGYLITNEQLAKLIRKLIIPFALNYFSVAFTLTTLPQDKFRKLLEQQLSTIASEKKKLCSLLKSKEELFGFKLFEGKANFVLLKFERQDVRQQFLESFRIRKIGVLDLSMFPKMENSVRISIGSPEENKLAINCIETFKCQAV